jgi:SOS response regulatory protein OraA/RecX
MNKDELKAVVFLLLESDHMIEDFENLAKKANSLYARGYLMAKIEAHNQESFEELKEDLITWLDYNIWL